MADPAVYLLGEAMLEFAPAGEAGLYRLGVAGDSFNTAVAISQLGTPCEYVTAVGEDAASAALLAALDRWGIGRDRVQRIPGAAPGLYLVDVDASGERSFSYWRERSAAAQLFSDPERTARALDGMAPGRWLYLSGISLAIASAEVQAQLAEFVDRYRASGGRLAFDCNYRAALWPDPATAAAVFEGWFCRSDLLLPGLDDLEQTLGLGGDPAVDFLRGLDVDTVVLKRGGDGPLVLQGGAATPVSGEVIAAPLDTTGAGDAFNGALLAALLQGQPLLDAASFAHRVAAAVVRCSGAILPQRDWEPFRNSCAKPE